MNLNQRKFLFLILGLTVFMTACVGQPRSRVSDDSIVEGTEIASTGRGAGDQLKILYWQAASFLNPYLYSDTKEVEAASLVLEPLARYNEKGELVPWLAKTIPTLENGGISEDLTTITWTLKESILWSDGTLFTAEDVVFTADYCLHEDSGCSMSAVFDDVKQVEALDEQTVLITFNSRKPYPYEPFVGVYMPILQKAQFADCMGEKAQQCTEQNFYPIGTGPYKVAEFKPNDVILFTVNETYREPNKPFFKEVVIKGGGDATSAARAVLETGEADYAWNIQVEPQILQEMEEAGKGKVVSAFGSLVERLYLNLTNPDPTLGDARSDWSAENPNPHPFLTDYAVRRALSLAIDRNIIAEQLYGAAGQPACNIIPAPAIYASPNNDECLTQNIEEAKAILDEAGWLPNADGIREKDGVRLSILYQTSTNSVRQSTQALIKQWWKEIGVETELRSVEGTNLFGSDPASPDTVYKFYADVQMFTSFFVGNDPENHLKRLTCDNIINSANQWVGKNFSRWCNESYDILLDELAETANIEQRAKIAIQLNDMAMQDYAVIPLIHRGNVSAQSNTLEGVILNAWDSELWNIADWTGAQ